MNDYSPSKKIWKKFRKNKFALGGLLFILATMIIGILG